MFPRPLRLHLRAGTVVKSLLTTMCGAAMLITAAAVLDPASLRANSRTDADPEVARDAHQEFLRAFCSIVSQSATVLAANDRVEDRGAEIVLWYEDTHDHGRINADELALLRHSPLFQTITMYTAAPETSAGLRRLALSRESAEAPALSQADVQAPGFMERWRGLSSVQAKVLATGLSDARISPVESEGADRLSTLRLHLRWVGDSADDSDEAWALVAGGRRSALDAATSSAQPQQEYLP